MSTESENTRDPAGENPLDDFSGCHEGIIRNFNRLRELAALIGDDPDDPQISEIAGKLVKFFDEVVYKHHAEEEQDKAYSEFWRQNADVFKERIEETIANKNNWIYCGIKPQRSHSHSNVAVLQGSNIEAARFMFEE